MRYTSLPVFLSSIALIACGGGDDDDDTTADAATDAPAVVCKAPTAGFGALGALEGTAEFIDGKTADGVFVTTALEEIPADETTPIDLLGIEFLGGIAPFEAGLAAKPNYELTGAQLNYGTCGLCLLLIADTSSTEDGDAYFVTGGTINLSVLGNAEGGTVTLDISDVTFEHVTINDETYESTPVDDGCETSIASASFTGTLVAPTERNRRQRLILNRTR